MILCTLLNIYYCLARETLDVGPQTRPKTRNCCKAYAKEYPPSKLIQNGGLQGGGGRSPDSIFLACARGSTRAEKRSLSRAGGATQ